ncbi:DUF3990 domain-containing protein [Aminipila luticellarii]|uniref:DUF3990 domain-containing protein n=1 Tax=Aminipila luticellarii TaxID=2507160 RepID=A0A410PWH9_9FIRM|nr:DUF3990 domain-containing protein [Aminipila luticellarii]QAT43289.1 DUF3990 domain-containing protein [Aminipila luticellarii]
MKLYHGSNMEIIDIDFTKCRPYKDFGQGFYLTTIKEQAAKMAVRVARIYGGSPCIIEYDFNDAALTKSNVRSRVFEKPNKEWALFVMNNRSREFKDITSSECNHDKKYDLVAGPIADDDLALLFRQFSNDMITIDILVKEMEFKQLTNQYSFHTKKAIKYLKKVGIQYE